MFKAQLKKSRENSCIHKIQTVLKKSYLSQSTPKNTAPNMTPMKKTVAAAFVSPFVLHTRSN